MEVQKKKQTEYSFLRAFNKVPLGESKTVKEEIKSILGITTDQGWYKRLYGLVTPNIREMQDIEKIFSKYGITDVWG